MDRARHPTQVQRPSEEIGVAGVLGSLRYLLCLGWLFGEGWVQRGAAPILAGMRAGTDCPHYGGATRCLGRRSSGRLDRLVPHRINRGGIQGLEQKPGRSLSEPSPGFGAE